MVHRIIFLAILFLLLPVKAAYTPFKIGNGSQAVSDVRYMILNGTRLVNLNNGNVKLYTPRGSSESNGGTLRSLQFTSDNGVTLSPSSISGNGGALRVTFDSSLIAGTVTRVFNGDVYSSVANQTSTPAITIKNSLIYNGSIFNTAFATKSTTNLSEGTNLYYTAARANGDALQVGTEQGWSAEDNGGTLGRIRNGNALIAIVNGTGYYTKITPVATLSSYTNDSNWSAEANGGTMRSIQPSGDNGVTFSVSSISGNGGGLRATFDSSLYQPSNGNLTTWAGKAVPTGVVVGTTDTQTLSSKTLSSPIINGVPDINSNAFSFSGLSQGSLLCAKQTTVVKELVKGTNHYRLAVNGNALTWESTATPGNNLSYFAATTSAQLAGVVSDETGSSKLVFNGSPSITSPTLTSTTLNRITTFNGNTMSLGTLAQGSLLVSKVSGTLKELVKGTNHYALKVNGNKLAWEALSAGGASEWTNNGVSAIYPNSVTTAVAIGYDGNKGKLNVNGDIAFKSQATPTLDMMGDEPRLYVKTSTGNLTFLKWDGMSQTEYSLVPSGTSVTSAGSSTDNHVPVWVGSGGNSLEDTPMVIDPMMGDASGLASLSIAGGGMSPPLVVATSALVVDGGGNVGISQASPDHRLDVVGTSEFSDQIDIANNKYISWSDGMSYTNILGLNSSNNLILQGADGMMSGGHIIIKPAQVEAMRLDKNGQVGIWDQSPDALLDVNGSFLAKSFSFNGTTMSLPALTQGDLLFAKEDATLQRLAKGTNHYALKVNGNKLAYEPLTTGTVTSVAVSGDNGVNILSGSPITSTGTIALSIGNITPNKVNATGTINGTTFIPSNGQSMLSLVNYGNGGSLKTIDPKRGNFIYMQLNGSTCAIKIAKPNGPTRMVLALRQFSATRLATWNADIAWPAATAPTLSTTSGYIDFVTCVHMGSTVLSNKWNCQFTGDLR